MEGNSMAAKQQDGHGDICRVCRGEATFEQPLFYPCLCSGSIKYVHQECLLEWLKHSKKKYCELCKHSYSFSPIYAERMPERLPITVIIMGLCNQVFSFTGLVLRYVYLAAVWLVFMPSATTAALCLYMGWGMEGLREGNLASIAFNMIVGLAITAGMVVFLMGLLLLRDYMLTHRLLRVRRRNNRRERPPPNITTLVEEPGEIQNNSNNVGESTSAPPVPIEERLNTEVAPSEAASTRTMVSRQSERSSWMQSVVPREYRAYLRRRDLYRERYERVNQVDHPPRFQGGPTTSIMPSFEENVEEVVEGGEQVRDNASVASGSVTNSNLISASNGNVSLTRPSIDSSQMETVDEHSFAPPHRRRSHTRESSRGESAHAIGGASSNVTFRDNIRCKICSSVVCINKEHVVLASQKSRQADNHHSTLAEDSMASGSSNVIPGGGGRFSPIPESIENNSPTYNPNSQPAEPIHQLSNVNANANVNANVNANNVPPAIEEEENGWNIWGINLDADNNNGGGGGGAMTLSEFIGLTGSLISILQNALVIVSCNVMIMHTAIFVPQIFGRAVLRGEIPEWIISSVRRIDAAFSLSLGSVEVEDSTLMSNSITTLAEDYMIWIYEVGSKLLHRILIQVYDSFPSVIQTRLEGFWLVSFKNIMAIKDLFTFSSGSYVDFFIQTAVGYFVVVALCTLYRMLVIEKMQKIEGAHRSLLQLFMLLGSFLKLTFILFIELVIFPIYCGWLTDVSLLPLFESTFLDRVAFYNSYPFLAQLIHWTIGTVVLVQVALFVKWLRGVFRPGLLYFIRNSDDPESLPLKEIVERSLGTQLARFLNSVVLYAILLVSHFYGFASLSRMMVPNLVPLNFSFRNVISEVPYDLLANIFTKLLIDVMNPGAIGHLASSFMRTVLKNLRLSSYFYGGRYLGEEFLTRGRWVFVPDFDRVYKAEKVRAMFHRKVEPLDIAKIPIVEGRESSSGGGVIGTTATATAIGMGMGTPNSVNNLNMPLEPRRPPRFPQARKDPTKGFTVVYRPNYCKLRVMAFFASLWTLFQTLGILLVVTPILVGRYFYSFFLTPGQQAPELHTLQVGFIIIGSGVKLGQILQRNLTGSNYKKAILNGLRLPIILFKWIFIIFFLGILWPTMGGVYLMLVMSPFLSSLNETPIAPLFTCWFIGFAYGKIIFLLRDMVCAEERVSLMNGLVTFDGWWNMNFKQVFLRLILPYTLRATIMIVGPPLAVLLSCSLVDLSFVQILMLQRWSYLLSLAVPAIAIGIGLAVNLRRRFLMRIRDETYLVGRRLHNLERATTGVVAGAARGAGGGGE